jgi:trigger factor
MEKEIVTLDNGLEFSLTYDVAPEVNMETWKGLEASANTASVTDADVDLELQTIRERNALVTDKDESSPAETGDVATIDYKELDAEGQPVKGGSREDFTFTLGGKNTAYLFDDDVVGMKAGETKTFEKTYPEDHTLADMAGKTFKFELTLKALKKRELPELDDDFAQDVNEKYNTLDDLKADIRKRQEESLEYAERTLKLQAVYDLLLEKNPVDLPETMIQLETDGEIRQQLSRMGLDPSKMPATFLNDEGFRSRMRPQVERNLKLGFLIEKLREELKIEVSDEDVEAELRKSAEDAGLSAEEVDDYVKNYNARDYAKEEIANKRTRDVLLAESKISVKNTVSYGDLMKEVNELQ